MLSPILMTFDAFYGQVNSRPTVIVSDLYTWIWNADLFQSGIHNFRIEQSFATSSKIRPDFSNKKSFRIEVTKKSLFTKSVRLNSYSWMKKKNQKDSDNFWHRKFTLKVQFLHFMTRWQSYVGKASWDAYNQGGWLDSIRLFEKNWIAEGVPSKVNDSIEH